MPRHLYIYNSKVDKVSHSSDRKKIKRSVTIICVATFGYHVYLRCLNGECDGWGILNACGKIDAAQKDAAWSDHGTTKV